MTDMRLVICLWTIDIVLALMATNSNIMGFGTCRSNLKGFASKESSLDKTSPRGLFVCLVGKRLGMVIGLKDSTDRIHCYGEGYNDSEKDMW